MDESLTVRCTSCGALNRVPAARAGQAARCGACKARIDTSGPAGAPVDVTDEGFDTLIRGAYRPVLLEFWSPSCGHCIRMEPAVRELARELTGRVKVAKLDVTKNPDTMRLYEINATPAFVLIKEGREAARFLGAMPKEELMRRLQEYI